ncbi:MAG: polysaccharide deacetylase family protein [Burkholderiales bacterium]
MQLAPSKRGILCLTFDNMGNALEIAEGRAGRPDAQEPGLAVGYPRLLDLLDELDLRGTFFIEGWNALHHPERVLELAERGHEVALHGWLHERFGTLERLRAQQVLYDGSTALASLGLTPTGFRAPGGLRGAHTAELLAELGYEYDSSAASAAEMADIDDDRPVAATLLAPGLAHIPWRAAMVDSIQYLRRRDRPRSPSEMAAAWIAGIDRAATFGGVVTMVVHAYVSGVDAERLQAVRDALTYARARSNIDITGAGAIAERMLATNG